MPKIRPLIIILILLSWALIVLGSPVVRETQAATIFQGYSKPLQTPDFSLEDLDGKTIDVQSFRGKVVLVNFWATW